MRIILLLTFAAMLAGCGTPSVEVFYHTSDTFPSRRPIDVVIYDQPPARPYESLATIRTSNYSRNDLAKMRLAICEKAAAIGADAVIMERSDLRPSDDHKEMQWWAKGEAVRFRDHDRYRWRE